MLYQLWQTMAFSIMANWAFCPDAETLQPQETAIYFYICLKSRKPFGQMIYGHFITGT